MWSKLNRQGPIWTSAALCPSIMFSIESSMLAPAPALAPTPSSHVGSIDVDRSVAAPSKSFQPKTGPQATAPGTPSTCNMEMPTSPAAQLATHSIYPKPLWCGGFYQLMSVLLHLTTPSLGRYLSTTPCVPSSKIAEHSVSFTPYSVLTLLWRPVRSPPQLNGPTMCGGRGLFRPNASMRRNQANQLLIINGEVMGGRDMGCKSRFTQRGLAPISQHETLLALAQGLEPLRMAPWTCAKEAPTWNTHICSCP